MSFENTVGKGEIAVFPTLFLPCYIVFTLIDRNFPFSFIFILSALVYLPLMLSVCTGPKFCCFSLVKELTERVLPVNPFQNHEF